jgi:hypothetical protein
MPRMRSSGPLCAQLIWPTLSCSSLICPGMHAQDTLIAHTAPAPTPPYPHTLHTTRLVGIQVPHPPPFTRRREGGSLVAFRTPLPSRPWPEREKERERVSESESDREEGRPPAPRPTPAAAAAPAPGRSARTRCLREWGGGRQRGREREREGGREGEREREPQHGTRGGNVPLPPGRKKGPQRALSAGRDGGRNWAGRGP